MDTSRTDPYAYLPCSSVAPEGRFIVGIHRPSFKVANLRNTQKVRSLGRGPDGREVANHQNFQAGDVDIPAAGPIFEIVNPLPFRGVTYIGKAWADDRARQPEAIGLPPRAPVSMRRWIQEHCAAREEDSVKLAALLADLPDSVQLALATTSTDPEDLTALAEHSAVFVHAPESGRPAGLWFGADGAAEGRPHIRNHALFEAVANNPYLPDDYKEVMVLRPGVQGTSVITAEWGPDDDGAHVYEYLRANSYIPWGHFAANMAEDAVRYDAARLKPGDIAGMRHLYYQRTYVRLARMLDLDAPVAGAGLSHQALEALRQAIADALVDPETAARLPFDATMWGWNFGFDYAPTGYRLHASHQQVHQQYALIPRNVALHGSGVGAAPPRTSYSCGDWVAAFVRQYRNVHGVDFFPAYLRAIRRNVRLDGRSDRDQNLVVHADDRVMLFVPKAQTSQWELQLVTLAPAGNILETDTRLRMALDRAIWIAIRTLGTLGARMVTTIEYAKRFDAGDTGQHLLYSFLPRLPESPGAFSEAQLRWIVGHYPEDFAAACRTCKPS